MEWTWLLLRENLHLALASCFLVLGVITDLLWKRVPNALFLSMMFGAFLFCFVGEGFSWSVLIRSLSLVLLAFGLGFGFFMFRILGAGDVKLFMAIAPLGSYSLLFYTFLYSFVWGALLGVFYILTWGRWKPLFKNLKYICKQIFWGLGIFLQKKPLERIPKPEGMLGEGLNYIPYTVAIFLAYLSCIGIYY